jgi:release factor glutamine methyltransferase
VRDHDPRVALDGGLDGLDVIRRLASWSSRVLRPGGWLAFEHGHDQAQPCAELLTAAGYQQVRLAHDLARRPRVTMARKAIAGASEG